MVRSEAQPSFARGRAHLVLYDGTCGLCDRLVEFMLRHDRRGVLRFASLQSDLGRGIVERSGGNPDELTSFCVVVDYHGAAPRVLRRSDATLFVAAALGWPWRAAEFMRIVPRTIRDRAYDVLARNRYRVFGRYERCPLPLPEFRNRFIE